MHKMLNVGYKNITVICDTCSKLSTGSQKQRHVFSLWTTFNNPHGALTANFSQIHSFGSFNFFNTAFLFQYKSEWTQVCNQNIWEETNKKWALERKPQKKNKLFYLKLCNVLGKILYHIRK